MRCCSLAYSPAGDGGVSEAVPAYIVNLWGVVSFA